MAEGRGEGVGDAVKEGVGEAVWGLGVVVGGRGSGGGSYNMNISLVYYICSIFLSSNQRSKFNLGSTYIQCASQIAVHLKKHLLRKLVIIYFVLLL